jgi:hypothetical protein
MTYYVIARPFDDEPEDYWGGFELEWVDLAQAKRFESEEAAQEEADELPGDETEIREIDEEDAELDGEDADDGAGDAPA